MTETAAVPTDARVAPVPQQPGAILPARTPGRARAPVDTASAGIVRLVAWAWELLSDSRWHIAGAAALSLLVTQIAQFNANLLVHAFALLRVQGGTAADGPASFLGFLMPDTLYATAVLFGVIAIGLFGLHYFDRFATLAIDTVVIYRLQEKLHQKVLRLGASFHTRNNMGALQMLFTRYVSQSAGVLRELLEFPVVNGIPLITASIYLWYGLGPLLENKAIMPLVIGSLIGLPIVAWRVSLAVQTAIRTSIAADVAVGDELVNTLRRPIDLQLLGAHVVRNQAFAARLRTALGARLRTLRRSELANQIQRGMPQLLQAGILVFAVVQFLRLSGTSQQAAVGQAIVAIIQFVPMILAPIQQAISFYNAATQTVPVAAELVNLINAQEEVGDAPDTVALRVPQGTISVRDVSVNGPDPLTPILQGVSQEFEGGRVWGVVGRAGCGKSTLLMTIARAVDPDRGQICIDGVDTRQVKLASLRQAMSYLGQFAPFIDGTVRSNLNLAASPVSDARLVEACRVTGILPRLQQLAAPASPLDLSIYAEANKGALSGGERRLLALARVVARPTPIILLDEPTSGVDAGTKGQIAQLIKTQLAGSTVIVVDHDLEFIADIADAVVCMERGTIVTSVPRSEIFERPSPFLDLWRLQRRVADDVLSVTSFSALSG